MRECVFLAALLCFGSAVAADTTFVFKGTVTSTIDNSGYTGLQVGDEVSGSYTFSVLNSGAGCGFPGCIRYPFVVTDLLFIMGDTTAILRTGSAITRNQIGIVDLGLSGIRDQYSLSAPAVSDQVVPNCNFDGSFFLDFQTLTSDSLVDGLALSETPPNFAVADLSNQVRYFANLCSGVGPPEFLSVQATITSLVADGDNDGVPDGDDLCADTASGDPVDPSGCSDAQVDADRDGYCDVNAPSAGPSVCLPTDNCPTIPNPDQADSDGDGFGDACVPPNIIPPGTNVGENPVIGAGTSFGSGTSVGDNAVIGSNVTVAQNVNLGDNITVGDNSGIARNSQVGDDVSIGSDVNIGQNVDVGSGTSIGDGTGISKGATIGENTVIGVSVSIGFNVQVGDNVTIGDNTTIGKDGVVGDGAMVGNNVTIRMGGTVAAGAIVPDGTVVPKNGTFP